MKIEAPTNCPSCDFELETDNSILYCRNVECPAQGHKLVENFAKGMKILGLGPVAIKKLGLFNIPDIYAKTEDELIQTLGSALGSKLYKNIQVSKTASLNQVLPTLGIPLIGKTATDKICASGLTRFDWLTEEIANKALGPKAAASLIKYFESGAWKELPFSLLVETKTKTSGKTVCITGKLTSFKTKAEAAKYLTEKGYQVVDSVTKTTEILVNESGIESSKTKKASANGTQIVNNIKDL
jgi:DNA ligase (NAD+)